METILEGGLTPEDLALIFADQDTFAAIDFTALSSEFVANLDAPSITQLDQAMEAFAQVCFFYKMI